MAKANKDKDKNMDQGTNIQTVGGLVNMAVLALLMTAKNEGRVGSLTETDGAPLVAAGLAEVHPSIVNADGTKPAQITDAGVAFYAEATKDAQTDAQTTGSNGSEVDQNAAPGKSKIEVLSVGAPPSGRAGGKKGTTYPFDDLAAPYTGADGNPVWAAFDVPVTATMPDPAKTMAGSVSNATKRHAVEQGTETVEKIVAVVGADGKPVMGVDGKPVKTKQMVTQPKLVPTREFIVRSMGLDASGNLVLAKGSVKADRARIWRTK